MKKYQRIISVLILISICILTGCSETKSGSNIKIQLYGNHDSELIKSNADVYQKYFNDYKEQDLIGTEKTIEWLGNTYTGKYKYTYNTYFYHAPVFIYETDTLPDGRICEFEIDSVNNEIVFFQLAFKQYNGLFEGKEIISEEECRTVSDEYIKKILPDDYTNFKFEESMYEKSNYGVYSFTYFRMVGEEKTVEGITIQINCFGEYEGHNASYLGMMKDAKAPAGYDEKEVEKAIGEKIAEWMRDDSPYKREDAPYKIEDKFLIKLQDGKTGFLYKINVGILPAITDTTAGTTTEEENWMYEPLELLISFE